MANNLTLFLNKIVSPFRKKETLSTVYNGNSGWFPLIREPFTGAWQRNLDVDQSTLLSYYAIFACTTLIASDISKLRLKLVTLTDDGIWTETTNPAYSSVINKPNNIQNRIQFWENWVLSKLIRGNTYILKERDNRNVVSSLYVLNPSRVTPLVSDDGEVHYRLQQDNIAGIRDVEITVPASEMIHDRWNCMFHPLVGMSPLYANNLAATQGMRIQQNSISLFTNASNPSGVLTAPDHITNEAAEEMKQRWEENFSGNNLGRVAVLGNGLSFQKMSVDAVDAQLIEQAHWTAEVICATFHVPPYKIGIGSLPSNYNNIQSLNVEYYSQCLQSLLESAELCFDEGLGLGSTLGVEFDIENLLRMDSLLMAEFVTKLTGSGVLEINEARKKFGFGSTPGGNAAYLQQQNYSLAALAKRDAKPDPFSKNGSSPAVSATMDAGGVEDDTQAAALSSINKKIIIDNIAVKQMNRMLSNANRA